MSDKKIKGKNTPRKMKQYFEKQAKEEADFIARLSKLKEFKSKSFFKKENAFIKVDVVKAIGLSHMPYVIDNKEYIHKDAMYYDTKKGEWIRLFKESEV